MKSAMLPLILEKLRKMNWRDSLNIASFLGVIICAFILFLYSFEIKRIEKKHHTATELFLNEFIWVIEHFSSIREGYHKHLSILHHMSSEEDGKIRRDYEVSEQAHLAQLICYAANGRGLRNF